MTVAEQALTSSDRIMQDILTTGVNAGMSKNVLLGNAEASSAVVQAYAMIRAATIIRGGLESIARSLAIGTGAELDIGRNGPQTPISSGP